LKRFTFALSLLLLFACEHQAVKVARLPELEKADHFFDLQKDSAFYYYNKVATTAKDSLSIARGYNGMAEVQSDAGDFFGSQESLLASLQYLREDQPAHASTFLANYNELGLNSFALKRYPDAIKYAEDALRFTQDPRTGNIVLNNLANAYQKQGDYVRALGIYDRILSGMPAKGIEYARALSNRARTQWLQNPAYRAAPDLLKALGIRLQAKDEWGLNASYLHLADYYIRTRPDSALYYGRLHYQVATRIHSPDDRLEALEKLITLVPVQEVKPFFAIYGRLNDSLQTARAAARNQFALIRYDAEKSKAESLRLRYQVVRQWVMLAGALLLLVGSVFWYRKRKRRLQEQAEQVIRENKLRMYQKVHDVVANGIYQVMSEIEYREGLDKEEVLDKMEVLYDRSRDISYGDEDWVVSGKPFDEDLADLLSSFGSENTRVLLIGSGPVLWEGVAERARQELRVVLQELMVNMRKHSKASSVRLHFKRLEEGVQVVYSDDGIGLKGTKRGHGLNNTETRIRGIGGTVSFAPNRDQGLRIEILVPFNP